MSEVRGCVLRDIENSQTKGREFCWRCRQTEAGCYCKNLRAFDPQIEFVVLIHKIEARRRIATGRMSHLILRHSHLIEGDQFECHSGVNELISDSRFFSVVLYPGAGSFDISNSTAAEHSNFVPRGKKLLIFVIDGTWATARRTMRLSPNLLRLPRICFSPRRESQFKVRQQPAPHCLSTLEAIHHTIELLGASQGFDVASRVHDRMLEAFTFMVEKQHSHVPPGHRHPRDKTRLTAKRAHRDQLVVR